MGKTNLPNGRAPVNLIYLDDCIGIIKSVIEREAWGEIFNACAEYHPEKQNYYTEVAKKMNLTVPVFLNELLSFKIIRSNKCKNQLNYIFKYPDPLEFPLD
jgi:nucleoside-diphosphate-sugar epimerase